MTPDELRAHVVAPKPDGHEQPADDGYGQGVDFADDAFLVQWHEHEHRPCGGYRTHLGHAHDEFTARREGVPIR